MKSFNESMAVAYVDYYNKNGEEQAQRFILTTVVAISVLNNLYDGFVKDGILPIEQISKELKEKFYKVACKYHNELSAQLKATKAAYVLSLITSNE